MNQKVLKVLLVSPLPPPAGGIASWTKQYLEWSGNNKLDVDIVNTTLIGKRAGQINTGRSLVDEIRRTKNIIKALISKTSQFKPDVVHLNTACGRFGIIRDYLCATLVKKKRVKLIVHYRCNIEDQVSGNMLQEFFFRRLAKKATQNLVLNTPSKDFLEHESGKKGKIIANFIDQAYILDEPKAINSVIENITFVGHVIKSKGVIEIIEVARIFPEITFRLAGPVSSEIRNYKFPDNLIVMGSIDKKEVRDLLSKSDLFLFPTYTEGFANALLEAMAMGLPIITTPVGANKDMIEELGGVMVRKKNYKDIVAAITKLQDQELRKKISAWNINKVRKKYIIDSVMENLISIYKAPD